MITDIRTESPFWLMKNGFIQPHTALAANISTDFVIVGGGISGALLAWHLTKAGAAVVVVERQHVAMGSTSASTALLQYDIDRTLHELIDMVGPAYAVRAYQLSLEALESLEKIATSLPLDCGFEQRSSLRFAEVKKDVAFLEKEFEARSKNGYEVELWDAAKVADKFPFTAAAALYTKPAAIADPYRLTHALLQGAAKNGAQIFDKTGVERIERLPRSVKLHTSQGHIVSAKKVIIACGYESVNFVPFKLASLSSTFALVSEPLPKGDIWFENAIFWNTNDPYTYGRTTTDNRIVFGGGDEPFFDPKKRDAMLAKKIAMLSKTFTKMFPDLPFKVDYSWAGTFVETDDGLPYIGSIKQLPHTYFALGYGGNGITFSQLAATILTDLLLGKKNKDADIFSFERTTD